jgi:hypothetical protein
MSASCSICARGTPDSSSSSVPAFGAQVAAKASKPVVWAAMKSGRAGAVHRQQRFVVQLQPALGHGLDQREVAASLGWMNMELIGVLDRSAFHGCCGLVKRSSRARAAD